MSYYMVTIFSRIPKCRISKNTEKFDVFAQGLNSIAIVHSGRNRDLVNLF